MEGETRKTLMGGISEALVTKSRLETKPTCRKSWALMRLTVDEPSAVAASRRYLHDLLPLMGGSRYYSAWSRHQCGSEMVNSILTR